MRPPNRYHYCRSRQTARLIALSLVCLLSAAPASAEDPQTLDRQAFQAYQQPEAPHGMGDCPLVRAARHHAKGSGLIRCPPSR